MTSLVTEQSRRTRQSQVESLLDELAARRRRLLQLKAGGALPAGLRDQKRDFRSAQQRLHDVLAAA